MEQNTGIKEVFLRLVAIVGLIAVLILGAWGIILLAFNLVGLFTGAVSFSSLFGRDNEPVATTTTPVVVVNPGNTDTGSNTNTVANTGSNTGTGSNTNTNTNTNTGSKPTAVYTPAATRATTLYGLPDLKVKITSVTSLSSVQGRTVIQFTVINGGTNVAAKGWSFNAQLPLSPTYTYQSQGQQALYPGDSIAFTLTYDDPRFQNTNQYCTLQYPNYNCNYNNYNQYPYQQYPYNNYTTGTCYTYNGYQNIPYPCDNGYSSGNSNYNYYNQYPYYDQNYNYYNPNSNNYFTRTVSVQVDPQNWIPESDEWNNTASKSF